MTKNIKKTENNIRQKMQEMLHKEDGFSFIEVIIVMAMILVLTAILIPNYLGFVETAREANVKMSAQNMYTAVQMANLNQDIYSVSEELYEELKSLNPALIGIGATYDSENKKLGMSCMISGNDQNSQNSFSEVDEIEYADLVENCCIISNITMEDGDFGYTFDYYQYTNGTLYCAHFVNGTIDSVEICDVVYPENSDNESGNESNGDDSNWPNFNEENTVD